MKSVKTAKTAAICAALILIFSALLFIFSFVYSKSNPKEKNYVRDDTSDRNALIKTYDDPEPEESLNKKFSVYTFEAEYPDQYSDHNKGVTFFTEEQIKELKEKQSGGKIVPLTVAETLYIINDSVRLFLTNDRVVLTGKKANELSDEKEYYTVYNRYRDMIVNDGKAVISKEVYDDLIDHIYEIITYRLLVLDDTFMRCRLSDLSSDQRYPWDSVYAPKSAIRLERMDYPVFSHVLNPENGSVSSIAAPGVKMILKTFADPGKADMTASESGAVITPLKKKFLLLAEEYNKLLTSAFPSDSLSGAFFIGKNDAGQTEIRVWNTEWNASEIVFPTLELTQMLVIKDENGSTDKNGVNVAQIISYGLNYGMSFGSFDSFCVWLSGDSRERVTVYPYVLDDETHYECDMNEFKELEKARGLLAKKDIYGISVNGHKLALTGKVSLVFRIDPNCDNAFVTLYAVYSDERGSAVQWTCTFYDSSYDGFLKEGYTAFLKEWRKRNNISEGPPEKMFPQPEKVIPVSEYERNAFEMAVYDEEIKEKTAVKAFRSPDSDNNVIFSYKNIVFEIGSRYSDFISDVINSITFYRLI